MVAPLLALIVAAAPGSSGPIKLAAPELTALNLPPGVGKFLSDHLAQQLNLRGVRVTTPSQIAAILGIERQKQLLGCTDDSISCMAELAGALGVDGVLTGSIGKLGDKLQANLAVISSADGKTLTAYSVSAANENELMRELTRGARLVAETLSKVLGRALVPVEAAQSSGLRGWAWVPAAGGAALGGAGALFIVRARGRSSALTGGSAAGVPDLTYDEALIAAREGKQDQQLGLILAGAGAAALIAGGAMFLLGGEDDGPAASLSVTGDGAFVAVRGSF